MSESAPQATPSEAKAPFVPNGRAPRGEFKTWKKPKKDKTEPTFKERRAKRVAAYQNAVASQSRLKEDGEHWTDAHQQFTTGEDAFVDDKVANTETTWEEISYDVVRESMARQMLEAERNLVDPVTKGMFSSECAAIAGHSS